MGSRLGTQSNSPWSPGSVPIRAATLGSDEHWGEILRLVTSLQAGTVLPSAMLKRLAAFQRQNQLDLALHVAARNDVRPDAQSRPISDAY